MCEGFPGREVLTVRGIAFGSVSFLVADSSKGRVRGYKLTSAGEERDVKIRAPLAARGPPDVGW